jgi:hypothetical protein
MSGHDALSSPEDPFKAIQKSASILLLSRGNRANEERRKTPRQPIRGVGRAFQRLTSTRSASSNDVVETLRDFDPNFTEIVATSDRRLMKYRCRIHEIPAVFSVYLALTFSRSDEFLDAAQRVLALDILSAIFTFVNE